MFFQIAPTTDVNEWFLAKNAATLFTAVGLYTALCIILTRWQWDSSSWRISGIYLWDVYAKFKKFHSLRPPDLGEDVGKFCWGVTCWGCVTLTVVSSRPNRRIKRAKDTFAWFSLSQLECKQTPCAWISCHFQSVICLNFEMSQWKSGNDVTGAL